MKRYDRIDYNLREEEIFIVIDLLILIYNALLSCAFCVAVACLYYHYYTKDQNKLLCIALLVALISYFVDNNIVFCTEIIPRFAEVYDTNFISNPSVKTVYFLILIGSLLVAFQQLMPAFSMKSLLIMMGCYAAALICTPLIPQNDSMVFFYYLPTQLLLFIIAVTGLVMLKRQRPCSGPEDVPLKKIFIFLAVMSVVIFLEDTLVIFFVDHYTGPVPKINNRNFSENVLFLGLSLYIISYTKQMILLRRDIEEPAELVESNEFVPSPYNSFSQAMGFTEREQEILPLLLGGSSQQEISDMLIISLGTVKTHIHNIYKKAQVSNRSQLQQIYDNYCQLEKESTMV